MISIDKIDTSSKAQVERFVQLPFHLYQPDSQWVPPLLLDAVAQLDRKKHPFYEHSEADFFIAKKDGKDVGRIAVLENRRSNEYHHKQVAQFYLFECENDPEAAAALFERAFEWVRQRGLNQVVGPKGFGPTDAYGLLVEGFENTNLMTMMTYNPPYYQTLIEGLGFVKEVDFISCFLDTDAFRMPVRIHRIAERVQRQRTLRVQRFKTVRELKEWSGRIGKAYNKAFVNNWEYYPLTEREVAFVVDALESVADPKLIKVIVHDEEVVGFLMAFREASPALRRNKGRLFPFGLIDILLEMRRNPWVAINGAGILPEFQGIGGNALLYSEMDKTIHDFKFKYGVLCQIAESAANMRRDLESLGATLHKNHRVYTRAI